MSERSVHAKSMERRRDGQQWVLDYVVKLSGREINYEVDERRLPADVKSHEMIPRVVYKRAAHREQLARAAEARGHHETATALYYQAVEAYRQAQHAIFVDDDAEKIHIHGRMEACYDRIVAISNGRIERVEITFEGQHLSALLHLAPGEGPRPLIVFCPGMDMTKEAFPAPGRNAYAARGMHVLSIDGPGQGVSNLRKIRLTADNYERAASAFLDAVIDRPEVDSERIGVSGHSMGTYWGMRFAAIDHRVKGIATSVACYASKFHIFERSSPRFKQIFMYMTGVHDEDQFDDLVSEMTLFESAKEIRCPVLMVTGEYDPLSPMDETMEVFDSIKPYHEIWALEDAFHPLGGLENLGLLDPAPYLADWLRDALDGRLPASGERKVLVRQQSGEGPYSEPVESFLLPDRI